MKKWIGIVGFALLAGCAPGNGEGLDANGRPLGESPGSGTGPAGTYKQIQDAVFTPLCTVCHAGAAAPVGLRLDTANSFAQLVNVASVEVPALLRVDPSNPDASYLVQKLEGTAAVGDRMPLGGAPVDPALIAQIRAWISAGALPDPPAGNTPAAPRVAAVVPANGVTLTSVPTQITVVFDSAMDTSLFGPMTVTLLASGGDGVFGDANDTPVTLGAITTPTGNSVTLNVDLTGTTLPDDTYQLTLAGTGTLFLTSLDGIALDGNSDGTGGDDFQSTFVLDTFVPPPADVTPPTLSIGAPAGPVQGSVILSVAAADDVGVTTVSLFVAGQLLGTLSAAPYNFAWDTTAVANGDYAITAEASDAAGNTGSATAVTVTVQNPPPADTTAPLVSLDAVAATVAGDVTISATASDAGGVSAVRFFVDDVLQATDTTAPYTFLWMTTAFAEGPHVLRAEAQDNAGNVATTADITVSVDNVPEADVTPPTVAVNALASPLSGTVEVGVSASDDVGVTAVRVFVDGVLLGTDTTAPFALSFDTTTVSDGEHVLSAQADDAAGNTGTSANLTVTIDNAPPPDTSAPMVTIEMPASTLTGMATLSVIASDDTAVTGVSLFVDGVLINTLASAPYAFAIDTLALTDGNHVVAAQADDGAGNRGYAAPIVVAVNNNAIAATLPWIQSNVFDMSCAFSGCHGADTGAAGLILSAGFSFSELVNVETERGGPDFRVLPGAPDDSALVQRLEGDLSPQMPLGGSPLAPALINAVRDWIAAGATEFAADVIAPAITLVLPPQPASGVISLAAEAVDDVAVTAVRFLVNGVEIGSALTTPYVLTFDTTSLANGPAAVVALAEDAAGNTTQSATQTLLVSNN